MSGKAIGFTRFLFLQHPYSFALKFHDRFFLYYIYE